MKTPTKKQSSVVKVITLTTKTVDRIVGLYDRIKMDNETKKTKKKALKVLLYSLIGLFLTFSVGTISTLLLDNFQKLVLPLGIDPYNGVIAKMFNLIEVVLIVGIIASSIAVIGNKRCRYSRICDSSSMSILDPRNPAGPNYIYRFTDRR